MKSGDAHQFRYQEPKPIETCIAAVNRPNAGAYEWHQLGVCLAELAVSARRITFDGWQDTYDSYLILSNKCYNEALECANGDACFALWIQCDYARNIAYMALDEEAISLLLNIYDDLQRLDESKSVNHQAAVVMSVLAQVMIIEPAKLNDRPGIAYGMDAVESQLWRMNAYEMFEAEREDSPDNCRAWRSLIIALAYGKACQREHFRLGLIAPLASAIANRDRGHIAKCLAIMTLGLRGERWLRKHRDGKLLALYPTPAEIPGFPKLS